MEALPTNGAILGAQYRASLTKLIELHQRLFGGRPPINFLEPFLVDVECDCVNRLSTLGKIFNYETYEQYEDFDLPAVAAAFGYELTNNPTALGNTILITGRDQAKDGPCESGLSQKIHTFRSDVSDPKAIATLYEEGHQNNFLSSIFWINNAGIMREDQHSRQNLEPRRHHSERLKSI